MWRYRALAFELESTVGRGCLSRTNIHNRTVPPMGCRSSRGLTGHPWSIETVSATRSAGAGIVRCDSRGNAPHSFVMSSISSPRLSMEVYTS